MKGSKGRVILDTDVASFMLKGLPLGAEYRRLTRGYDLRLSFATATELRVFAHRKRWVRVDDCTRTHFYSNAKSFHIARAWSSSSRKSCASGRALVNLSRSPML